MPFDDRIRSWILTQELNNTTNLRLMLRQNFCLVGVELDIHIDRHFFFQFYIASSLVNKRAS